MPKKIYIKDESFDPIYKEVSKGFYAKTKIVPSLLFFSGLLIFVSQVLLPVLVFKTQNNSTSLVDNATVVGRTAGFYKFEFDELAMEPKKVVQKKQKKEESDGKDTTVLGNNAENKQGNTPQYFYLTIPKLNIEDALVETESESLNPKDALGHYQGTALPGENGNAFIYGHSVLPWFFNPNNYKTIFSTLDRLEPGDEFYVEYNNNEYTYVVESIEELKPEEVDPLAEIKPKYLNESTMVLMTCSPPGTKLKRLMVNAVLVN